MAHGRVLGCGVVLRDYDHRSGQSNANNRREPKIHDR